MTLRPKDYSFAAVGERRWAVSVSLRSARLLQGRALSRLDFYADSQSAVAAIDEVVELLRAEGIPEQDMLSIEAERDPY